MPLRRLAQASPRVLLLAVAAAAAAGAACVAPLPLESRPCGCAAGFRCCEATNVCVTPVMWAQLECGRPDADAGDAQPARTVDDGGAAEGPGSCTGGGGVRAAYFWGEDFAPPAVVVRDEVGFRLDWKNGSPHPAVPDDHFSSVLSAELVPEETDDYVFSLDADDGARMWIDGELLLDKIRPDIEYPVAAPRRLEAGHRYRLLVEHIEAVGNAKVELMWRHPPTFSNWRPIPSCMLHPVDGQPSGCVPRNAECIPPGTPSCGQGTGLLASYYHDESHTQLAFTRPNSDATYDFTAGGAKAVPPLWVRFEGYIEAPATEDFTFHLLNDFDAKLFIEGRQIEATAEEGTSLEEHVTVPLVAGKRVPIRIDAHPRGFPDVAFLQLRWSSPSVPKGRIPTCRYFPPAPPDAGSP